MRSTTQDDKTEKVGITLPISLVKQIEKMRGDIPRSTWVEEFFQKSLTNKILKSNS